MAQLHIFKTKHWLAVLVTLFVVVLLAHLFALDLARGRFSIINSQQTTAFSTRMIELQPDIQKSPDVAPPPKPVKPKEKPVDTPIPQLLPKQLPQPIAKAEPAPVEISTSGLSPIQAAEPVNEPSNATVSAKTVTGEASNDSQSGAAQSAPSTAAGDSGAAELPPPAFTAMNSGMHTYKVIFTKNANSNQGNALIKWQQDGEKYTLNMTASMLFIDVFIWGSTGNMSSSGLQPERFSDKRYRKSEVAAHFDRVQNKIIFSANKPEVALLTGAQDRISVIWQIAGMLSADPKKFQPGVMFSLQTVSSTDAEPWLFTVNEPETLNLEKGSEVALRLTRNPRREFDQKIELWFAPALNYLPVRFRFTETNGDYVDVVWQSVENIPNAFIR